MRDGLEALSRHATATIHEAMGRRGALGPALKPISNAMRLCGPAFTVRSPGGDNLWIHHAIYRAQPGDVLVVQTGEESYGYWGEVMTVAAQARGLGGLVIHGCVRDADRLAEIGFPVFATGVYILGTVKDPDVDGALGCRLTLGNTVVNAGDVVIGDRDGVVVVPADEVDATVAAAEERVAKEDHQMDALRQGQTTLELFNLPTPRGLRDG